MGITKCEWIKMDAEDHNCYNKPTYIVDGDKKLYLCNEHARWYRNNGYRVEKIEEALNGKLMEPRDIFFED